MKLRITPAQAERVNALIRSACCNCVKDRCLLLGGGRDSPCIQLLCVTGIYCRYFREAVLPAEKELYEEIQNQNERGELRCDR